MPAGYTEFFKSIGLKAESESTSSDVSFWATTQHEAGRYYAVSVQGQDRLRLSCDWNAPLKRFTQCSGQKYGSRAVFEGSFLWSSGLGKYPVT